MHVCVLPIKKYVCVCVVAMHFTHTVCVHWQEGKEEETRQFTQQQWAYNVHIAHTHAHSTTHSHRERERERERRRKKKQQGKRRRDGGRGGKARNNTLIHSFIHSPTSSATHNTHSHLSALAWPAREAARRATTVAESRKEMLEIGFVLILVRRLSKSGIVCVLFIAPLFSRDSSPTTHTGNQGGVDASIWATKTGTLAPTLAHRHTGTQG